MNTQFVRRSLATVSAAVGISLLTACSTVPTTRPLRFDAPRSTASTAPGGQVIQMTSDDTSVTVNCQDDDNLASSLRSIGTSVSVDRVGGVGHLRFPGRARNARLLAPLIVIDGVPLDQDFEVSIPAQSIARVDVMRDSVATRPYGSRGKTGVVLVTLRPH